MESSTSISRPGFGRPITARSQLADSDKFPIAVFPDEYEAPLRPTREYAIMELVNVITDKPEWDRKIYDAEIVAKWRQEILNQPLYSSPGVGDAKGDDQDEAEDVVTDVAESKSVDSDTVVSSWSVLFEPEISDKMIEWAFAEVKYKAELFKTCKCVEALDGVWKSDTIIPDDLKADLMQAAARFENVPEKEKDWHPGSNGQVLDLVHPSVYPLVYGQSQILETERCGVDDCLSWIGKGVTLPAAPHDDNMDPSWSEKYQWLPSEFATPVDTEDVQLLSYMNNVHPTHQPELYSIIPKFVAKAIPLWDRVLSGVEFGGIPPRVSDWSNGNGLGYPKGTPDTDEGPPRIDDEDEEDYDERYDTWMESREIVEPEPTPFKTPKERLQTTEVYKWGYQQTRSSDPRDPPDTHPKVDLRRDFGRLQIIVKLANIHLTPQKPSYPGGSWHVEGQANESICASAIYYYDSENVTDSHLSFRQNVEDGLDLNYEQGDHRAVTQIYGFENEDPTIQNLGAVVTRKNRLLCFPNVMQHRVSSFKLQDKSKPGYRKILALFLVDPHIQIISTENVPPQQHAWWKEVVEAAGVMERLPMELWQNVLNSSDYPVGLEKAREQREELMSERRQFVKDHNQSFVRKNTFNVGYSSLATALSHFLIMLIDASFANIEDLNALLAQWS